MNRIVWIIVIIIIIILVVAFAVNNDDENGNTDNGDDDVAGEVFNTSDFQFVAELDDVNNGNSSGVALARYENGVYTVGAQFENLPELAPGFFYEGWVVRPEPFHFVSTGEVEFTKGGPINEFSTNEDLRDHTRYILTLEPDDGDPAPADPHIVEGDFEDVE